MEENLQYTTPLSVQDEHAVVHQTIRIADCWLLIGLNQQSPIDNQQFHFARGSAFRAGSMAS
jgi:hypothetical protein